MTIHMICCACGSTEVGCDATACWDATKGEWVLGTVHDDRYCDQCGDEANLVEVDEAEGMEIQVSGMIQDGENSYRLVEDHEIPEFFDVMVRTTSIDDGEILILHEFEDLDRKQADVKLNDMILLYRTAGVECFYGAEVGASQILIEKS